MATAQSGKSAPKKSTASKTSAASKTDAIAFLEKQHREVEGWFEQFEKAKSDARKLELFQKINIALKAHTQVEEEIFYPEARRATGDEDLLDEAVVEHQAAKQLMGQIETMKPGDDLYDAKVKVLGEEIEHHVEEEEKELFPKCRKSDMDLAALGKQMAARFKELSAQLKAETTTIQ
jgi:hemerythrin superfamily protein